MNVASSLEDARFISAPIPRLPELRRVHVSFVAMLLRIFLIRPFWIGLLVDFEKHRDSQRVEHVEELLRIYCHSRSLFESVDERPGHVSGVGELLLRKAQLFSPGFCHLSDHAGDFNGCCALHFRAPGLFWMMM